MNEDNNEMPTKPSNNKTIVKDSFVTVCSNSTAHALPNIFRSEVIWVQIFWFIILLGGVGTSVYYTYVSIYAFLQYPVTVSLNRYDKNIEDFPAVTICNVVPFDSSNTTVVNYEKFQLRKNNLSSEILPTDDLPAIHQVRQGMKVVKASVLADKLTNKLNFEMGFTLDTMLISCYFDGTKCNTSDFVSFYTFDYGNCYTFNSDTFGIKTTSKYGPGNGLTMELFTGFPGKQDYLMEARGLYVAVHNNSETPIVNQQGIKVPVGYSTDIQIRRTFYDRLPYPYSSCRDDTSYALSTDSIYFNKTIKVASYTRKLCIEVCLQFSYIIPTCKCSDPQIILTDKDQVICQSINEVDCVEKARKNFDSSDLYPNCEDNCPTECDSIDYNIETILSDYPTEYYYGIVSKQPNLIDKFSSFGNISYDRFKKSVLMINVYYHDLSYTMIEESQALTYEDVLGVIGGQVGLFLGASFLTFFEPFEFLIDAIYKMIKNSKNRVKAF